VFLRVSRSALTYNSKKDIREVDAMRVCSSLLTVALCLGVVAPAWAQFKEGGKEGDGTKLGKAQVTRWRVGLTVTASGGACRNMFGYVSVPTDWPEQEVNIVEEDVSPEAKVTYQTLNGEVKVMMVKIAHLAAGQEAKALVTFEVRRSEILPPQDTDAFVLPDTKKLSREIRPYLAPSPKIESQDRKIRELAKEIGADKVKAWDRVEAIYDWVREHIKDKDQGGVIKGAVAALKDGNGDCEARTSVFVALCRAADIPARTVMLPGHVYPEFYLCDGTGEGHWFPCQSRGARQFGGMTDLRPILQKGDNIRPPRNSGKEHQRFLAESLIGAPSPGGGKPQVKFVRETVAK
jgi:hypothetical protein